MEPSTIKITIEIPFDRRSDASKVESVVNNVSAAADANAIASIVTAKVQAEIAPLLNILDKMLPALGAVADAVREK